MSIKELVDFVQGYGLARQLRTVVKELIALYEPNNYRAIVSGDWNCDRQLIPTR